MDPVERLGVRRLVTWAAVRVRENPVLVGLFLLAGLVGYVPLVGGLLAFLVTTFVLGAAFVVVRDDAALQVRELGAVVADVRDRYITLLLVSIAYTVAVAVGLVLLVVPGLYVAARLSPALTIASLEDRDVGDALREGWEVGRGNVLRLFGVFLAVLVLQVVAAAVLALIGGTTLAASGVSTVILNAVFAPVVAAAVAHVYFESRGSDAEEPTDEMTADAAV